MFPAQPGPSTSPFVLKCCFNTSECHNNHRDEPVFLSTVVTCQPCLNKAWSYFCAAPTEVQASRKKTLGPQFTSQPSCSTSDSHRSHKPRLETPDVPLPIAEIKTEKDLANAQKKNEEKKANKKKKSKVTFVTPVKEADPVRETKTKKKKKRSNATPINGWYDKYYGKKRFKKVRVVVEKLSPKVLMEAAKNWCPRTTAQKGVLKAMEEYILPDDIEDKPNTNVLANLLWTTKDSIPLKPFNFGGVPAASTSYFFNHSDESPSTWESQPTSNPEASVEQMDLIPDTFQEVSNPEKETKELPEDVVLPNLIPDFAVEVTISDEEDKIPIEQMELITSPAFPDPKEELKDDLLDKFLSDSISGVVLDAPNTENEAEEISIEQMETGSEIPDPEEQIIDTSLNKILAYLIPSDVAGIPNTEYESIETPEDKFSIEQMYFIAGPEFPYTKEELKDPKDEATETQNPMISFEQMDLIAGPEVPHSKEESIECSLGKLLADSISGDFIEAPYTKHEAIGTPEDKIWIEQVDFIAGAEECIDPLLDKILADSICGNVVDTPKTEDEPTETPKTMISIEQLDFIDDAQVPYSEEDKSEAEEEKILLDLITKITEGMVDPIPDATPEAPNPEEESKEVSNPTLERSEAEDDKILLDLITEITEGMEDPIPDAASEVQNLQDSSPAESTSKPVFEECLSSDTQKESRHKKDDPLSFDPLDTSSAPLDKVNKNKVLKNVTLIE